MTVKIQKAITANPTTLDSDPIDPSDTLSSQGIIKIRICANQKTILRMARFQKGYQGIDLIHIPDHRATNPPSVVGLNCLPKLT
jgi:hypothetical protein